MTLEEIEKYIKKQRDEYYPIDVDGIGLIDLSEKLLAVAKAVKYHVDRGIVDPHDRLQTALEELEKE